MDAPAWFPHLPYPMSESLFEKRSKNLSMGVLSVTGYGIKAQKSWNGDSRVGQIPAADGIFILNGGDGPTVISSQGQVFDDYPETNIYWCTPTVNLSGRSALDACKVEIDGITYRT